MMSGATPGIVLLKVLMYQEDEDEDEEKVLTMFQSSTFGYTLPYTCSEVKAVWGPVNSPHPAIPQGKTGKDMSV
jgi:hypothetical protein